MDQEQDWKRRYSHYYEDENKPSFFSFSGKWKWIVGIFGIGILALLIIGSQLEKYLGEKLWALAEEEIQTSISKEDISISIFKSFPHISVVFEGINIEGSDQSTLLKAGQIGASVSFWNIINGNYFINDIFLEDANIKIVKDRKGSYNYEIVALKPDAKTEPASDLKLSFQKIKIRNTKVSYLDKKDKLSLISKLNKIDVKGNWETDNFDILSNGSITIHKQQIGNQSYVENLNTQHQIRLQLKDNQYHLINSELKIEDQPLAIHGFFEPQKNGIFWNLKIGSSDGNLATILSLTPKELLPKRVQSLKSKGDFSFATIIRGLQNDSQTPQIGFKCELKNGSLQMQDGQESIQNLSFKMTYKNGKKKHKKTSSIRVSNIKGGMGSNTFEGDVLVQNFVKPYIDIHWNGDIAIHEILPLFTDIPATDINGYVNLDKIDIKGKVSDFSNGNYKNITANGTLSVQDVGFKLENQFYKMPTGSLALSNNTVTASNLKLETNRNDILLNGKFHNLVPTLLHPEGGEQIKIEAKLKANNIDLNEWITNNATQKVQPVAELSSQNSWLNDLKNILSKANGSLRTSVTNFKYNKMRGKDFDGSINLSDNNIFIDGDIESMGGTLNMEGKLSLDDESELKANISGESINAHRFFDENNNFGQQVITDKNIDGNLTTLMHIETKWDKKGTFDADDLKVFGYLKIEEGELNDFKMLESFKTVLNGKRLNNVRFNVLENWIEIEKGNIHIPTMFIQNNAANLLICGRHNFSQEISYDIRVNAVQALAHSWFNKKEKQLLPDKKGFLNWYTSIRGNVDDFEIRNLKNKQSKHLFSVGKQRKEKIRTIINDEFGGNPHEEYIENIEIYETKNKVSTIIKNTSEVIKNLEENANDTYEEEDNWIDDESAESFDDDW